MNSCQRYKALLFALITSLISACGSDSGSPLLPPPPPPPAADITVSGSIYDGAVSGGTLFVFDADTVNAALTAAAEAADRAAALGNAGPLVQISRDVADAESYSLAVPGSAAGSALFFVLDAEGARDAAFGDQPFSLEAVTVAADAGSQMTLNITSHTTLVAIQVRALLDPDGDGTVIDAATIAGEKDVALANARDTFGTSALGDSLFPNDEDPHDTADADVLDTASSDLGLDVRMAAAIAGISNDEAMFLFAADAADGVLDASAPVNFVLDMEQTDALVAIDGAHRLGRARMTDVESVSCASTSTALRRACEFEVLDEYFIGRAVCAHSASEADADTCLESYDDDRADALEECGAVTQARLDLCVATADAVHDPAFGQAFAANFVDPLEIGATITPNPWLPLLQGTEWVYEGTFDEDGETITEVITITVTDRIKLIDGIRCVVVRDVVEIDGELVEDTDDWFAQDTDGNVWYCGEEAKDYEFFDGDVPAVPELVAIDGSFKSGRDGDEAGIQLPAVAVIGDIFRQEVSFANAEDVIEILATDASEVVPAAVCIADCLLTRDFSPLDPGVEENKYYKPNVGKVLEIDLETGNRVELISVTMAP